jgi:hypothetical protein
MKKIIPDRGLTVFIFIAIFFWLNGSLSAQNAIADSLIKSFRLFEDDSMIEITLRFNLTRYFRTKPQEDYMKANITFHLSETDSISRDIKLKTRGVFRNQYCSYPPIELNFKKADFGYSDLDKISKLKLATQCSSGKIKADYILREYLAYKLFNVLTDTSYRVRLLTINYVDSEKKRKSEKQFGFFLEPVETLTERTNSLQIKTATLTQKSIVPRIMDRFTIFNYMIGNYDWAVPGLHNVTVIRPLDAGPYNLNIAIPHDFDWTGLVNASYAVPAEIVGTDNVRQRIFEGVCRTKEVYLKDLEQFRGKKQEFYRVINEFPYINQKDKKDMTGYLDGFFIQMEGKNNSLVFDLLKSCKNF